MLPFSVFCGIIRIVHSDDPSMPWVREGHPEDFYEIACHYSRHAGLVPNKPFGFAKLGVDRNQSGSEKGLGDWNGLADIKDKCPRMGFFCLWAEGCSPVAKTSINADNFMKKSEWVYLNSSN